MVQSLVSNASSSWDLCIMYVHLPAVSKHSITMELTTHGGHKVSYLSLFASLPHLLDIPGSYFRITCLLSLLYRCISTSVSAIQMCLNLTTSFLELLDSPGSLINPRPHSATAAFSVNWGPPTNGEQCPLETSLQVALEGRVTTEQWNLVSSATGWPYDACRQNIQDTQQWGRHHIPLTRACLEVAYELTTLRQYNMSITSINVSTVLPHELTG